MPTLLYGIDCYKEQTELMQNLNDQYSQLGDVYFSGDFNAVVEPDTFTDYKDRILHEFLLYNKLVSAGHIQICTGSRYTFTPARTMIDHFVLSDQCINRVRSMHIVSEDEEHVISDHLPILISLRIMTCGRDFRQTMKRNNIAWNKLDADILNKYYYELDLCLKTIEMDTFSDNVNGFYGHIVNAIQQSSDIALPKSKFNYHAKPYWSNELKESHKLQRQARYIWINEGRPRVINIIRTENIKIRRETLETFKNYL